MASGKAAFVTAGLRGIDPSGAADCLAAVAEVILSRMQGGDGKGNAAGLSCECPRWNVRKDDEVTATIVDWIPFRS